MLLGVNFSCEFSKPNICNLDIIILTWDCEVIFLMFNLNVFSTAIIVENFSKDKQSQKKTHYKTEELSL